MPSEACPECGGVYDRRGLLSHRKHAHGFDPNALPAPNPAPEPAATPPAPPAPPPSDDDDDPNGPERPAGRSFLDAVWDWLES